MAVRRRITTFQIISIGFAVLILIGALLLMLPAASNAEGPAAFSDCLFTATSAVCVTGLVVRDTATYWTPFGQTVILLLIQIGGMGVVTAAVCLAFASGSRIGLMQRTVMQEAISAPQVGGIVRLTRFIVATAFAIEAAGAAALATVFVPMFGWGRGLWYAVFHSVSAFCNAGFDLMGIGGEFSSMTSLVQQPVANIAVILLITVGGIGFMVWDDIRQYRMRFKLYRLQSKIVIYTSAVLVLIPLIWFYLCEMQELGPGERVLPSLFQAVTLRTAGFNTVDLSAMSGAGQSLMIIWMLIGGSPGSTAGGMKTTTVAVLLLTTAGVIRRKDEVECFGRRIGGDIIRRAVAILTMYFLMFFAAAIVISWAEQLPFATCLFETASALGTVGLTLGITSGLGALSRAILMILMFLGRVGSLTLIYAAQSVRQSTASSRPLEKITVG